MKNYIIILILLTSCGFLESSSINIKEEIIGDFVLIEDNNDFNSKDQLVLMKEKSGYIVIKTKCKEVFYNSPYIFVKSYSLSKQDTIYFFNKIEVIDSQYNSKIKSFEDIMINNLEYMNASSAYLK